MPQFCRHKRFVERCPICSAELPDLLGGARTAERRPRSGASSTTGRRGARNPPLGRDGRGRDGLRVYAEGARSNDDGYRSELAQGLRSSEDARRLGEELAFAGARLTSLQEQPDGVYGTARRLADERERESASVLCFLTAYMCPLEGEQPFADIEEAFARLRADGPEGVELDSLRYGPRSPHRDGEGARALLAFLGWCERGGSCEAAFAGDPEWSAQRRFARVFERLSIHGLPRAARFELLLQLGALRLFELSADSLHLGAASAPGASTGREPVLEAAKRVFGIGDALTLERRAAALAEAASVPLGALDLALYNWSAHERVTLGVAPSGVEDLAMQTSAALGV